MIRHKAESFPPVVGTKPHTLILGSMPGLKSLEAGQYYAHPQNAFWKIMVEVFGMPAGTYVQKLAIIKSNNLALWDVLKYCERTGSLDTGICDDTIEINDFEGFLSRHRGITRVFFNGGRAEREFLKRVLPDLSMASGLTFSRLPSTSPAHAGMPFKAKVRAWAAIKANNLPKI